MTRQEVRRHPRQQRPHVVHKGDAHGVFVRDPLDDAGARVLARGQRLAEQVLDVQDLDVSLAHARHELVVLPLRPLDPEHVVEQELVVVARGQPLQAQLGPVHDDLPQLADLGVNAEATRHLITPSRARHDVRAGGPCHHPIELFE